ncbi:hypothetical protein B0O80DRAFT_406501, partial [Mortierella sp. GBAus27b]
MISSFVESKSDWCISLDPLTYSSTKSVPWKAVDHWIQKTWWSCAPRSPILCTNSWQQQLVGSTPFAWTTYGTRKAPTTSPTTLILLSLPSSRKKSSLFERSPTRLNRDNPNINNNGTGTRTMIDKTPVPTPAPTTTANEPTRSIAATITATTTLLFDGVSTTDGGTTTEGNEGTANDEAEATPADQTGESRRETRSLLRRMAEYYRQPRHTQGYSGRLSNTIRQSTANIGDPSNTSPDIGGSHEVPRLRSVRFADQGSHRMREWTRIYKPPVRYPQKDGRLTTSTEPARPERVPPYATFQNGNDPTCLLHTKPQRLSDVNRLERCFPSRPDPSQVETVSPIPLEGSIVPIQGSPIRLVSGTSDLHQGTEALVTMGEKERHPDFGVPGRPDHRGSFQGEISQGHRDDSTTPGIRDRHHDDDTQGPRPEDSRHKTRSLQVGEQGLLHCSSTVVIHRQSHRYDSSGLSCTTEGSASSSGQDQSSQIGHILGNLDLSDTSSNRGALVVAHPPATVER